MFQKVLLKVFFCNTLKTPIFRHLFIYKNEIKNNQILFTVDFRMTKDHY